MEFLIKVSWLISALALVGVVLNIYKIRWCFGVWLGTNCYFCALDFAAGLYAQSALFAVYAVLAVWGLIRWAKEEDKGVGTM